MAPAKSQRYNHPKSKNQGSPSPASALITEADRLRKQAERKEEGQSREPLLLQCAKLLHETLSTPIPSALEDEVLFDLGDIYALLGSASQTKMYQNLGNILGGHVVKEMAFEIEANGVSQSITFYRLSHEMYEKVVVRDTAVLKSEALTNSGNSLCDWAELMPVAMGSSLFEQADLRYSAALSAAPDDVELLTNFADCKVKQAELEISDKILYLQSAEWLRAKELYSSAMAAYGHACSLADGSVGDDLAGLLQNWGAGLSSLAKHDPSSQEALLAHDQAMEKLRSAAKFRPTDITIFIAIGEACCAQAERVPPKLALELLDTAVEEGFGAALKINITCLDAVIGKAEACFAAARVAHNVGTESVAENYYVASLNSYLSAVQILKADTKNECKLKFEEQCNVLYNLACVAAICGKESIAADALTLLARVGGLSFSDLSEDQDFQSLRTKEWFILLQKDKK